MKVSLRVTVEVSCDEWATNVMQDGMATPAEVRRDVRDYFANHIGGAQAVEDASLTVRVA